MLSFAWIYTYETLFIRGGNHTGIGDDCRTEIKMVGGRNVVGRVNFLVLRLHQIYPNKKVVGPPGEVTVVQT